jgi:hypothetical protein
MRVTVEALLILVAIKMLTLPCIENKKPPKVLG